LIQLNYKNYAFIIFYKKGFFSKALVSSPDKNGAKVDTLVDYNSASNSGIPSFSIDLSCSQFTAPANNGAQIVSLNVNKILLIYNLKILNSYFYDLIFQGC
jgi:hypothetical protein